VIKNGDPRKAAVRPRPEGLDFDLTLEVLWLALLCIHRGTSRKLFVAEPDGRQNTYLPHYSGQEELSSICLLGSKQPGAGEPHYQSLVYTSSLIILAAIRDGPYLKKVESKTHSQIAVLARRRTILQRVELSVHHAVSFTTIT